jgi:hypothetical protein
LRTPFLACKRLCAGYGPDRDLGSPPGTASALATAAGAGLPGQAVGRPARPGRMPAAPELARPAADPAAPPRGTVRGRRRNQPRRSPRPRRQAAAHHRAACPPLLTRGHGQQPRGSSLQYLPHGVTVAHGFIVRENSAGQPCQPAMMLAQMSQFSAAFAVSLQLMITAQIGSRAMSDQDREHSVTNADLHRGALPNPGAVRLADHIGWARAAPPSLAIDSGLMVSHWKGPLPAIGLGRIALTDGQVNCDASPHTESPGPSLRRRPQLGASCWRGVLRVGA